MLEARVGAGRFRAALDRPQACELEIYNRGAAPADISSFVIADDNAGTPNVAAGAVIPMGTVLDAHG